MPVLYKNLSLGTAVYILLIALVVGLLSGYAAYQARAIVWGPVIVLNPEPATVVGSSTTHISGTATNIIALRLNGLPVYTDDRGNFSLTLVLPQGYTIMTLAAEDRYGRHTTLTRTFVRESVP